MPEQSMWGLVIHAVGQSSGLEKAVLLGLISLSILSWALVIMKVRAVRRAKAGNAQFLEIFSRSADTGEALVQAAKGPYSPLYEVFKIGIESYGRIKGEAQSGVPSEGNFALKTGNKMQERIVQAMQHASKYEFTRMNWGLDILASIGSASPFIGLFGTVWGIMATFQTLGTAKSASLNVVAPGISAALIATAAGLAVAIPAVAMYNYIMARMDELQEEASCFIERVALLIEASGISSETTPLPTKATRASTPVISIPSRATAPEKMPVSVGGEA